MKTEAAFRLTFITLTLLLFVIRIYYGVRVRRSGMRRAALTREAIQREGAFSFVVRGILFLVLVAALGLYIFYPPAIAPFTLPLPAWLRWAGAAVSLASLPLLIWVHEALGNFWSTNLQLAKEHRLITGGPYRWVRHPMYSALFLFMLGGAVLSANIWIIVAAIGSIAILSDRIPKEEAMLIEEFGDEYREYKKHTGRLLPGRPVRS